MAAFLKKTERSADFAKGGDTPMFGKGDRTVTAPSDAAGEQRSGVTEHDPEGGSGDKFAKGGNNKMFGYSGSMPARGGITSAR